MKSLIEFIQKEELDQSEEIVFFGGSFHPWHEGHSECVRLLPEDKNLIIVPDHSPHKKMTPSQEKFSNLQDIKYELSKLKKNPYLFDGFWQLNQVNPTVVWIDELHKLLPNVRLSLLLGFDSFKTITTWNHPETLLNALSKIYVVSRLENKEDQKTSQDKILKINPNIEIDFLGHHPFEHISSTIIRDRK